MTERSENNLTEIMDQLAQKWTTDCDPPLEWENLSMDQRRKIKERLLPTMMFVLAIADKVDEEARTYVYGVKDESDGSVTEFGDDEQGARDWMDPNVGNPNPGDWTLVRREATSWKPAP